MSTANDTRFTVMTVRERLFVQLLKEEKGKIPPTNADKLLECKQVIHTITALPEILCI